MSAILSRVGLGPSSPLHVAGYLMWNWWYAYGMLAPRHLKQYYGVDHNKAPRQDINDYGEKAVKERRLSPRALDRIKRCQAASENSVEGFTFFVASVLLGVMTKLPAQTINLCCASYTLARLLYGPAYVLIESEKLALIRTFAWWWGNISCLTLLWKAGNVLVANT